MSELYYAEMEATRNDAEDAYFKARPQLLRSFAEQALFRAGFERGFEPLWRKLQAMQQESQHLASLAGNLMRPADETPATLSQAINEYREARAQLWKKRSDGDPACAHCGRTWDMHVIGGICPTPPPYSAPFTTDVP